MTLDDSSPKVFQARLSAEEIAADITQRLAAKLGPLGSDSLREGLIQVLAHNGELLIERLNRVPQTHRLAFTRMLGEPAQSPLPARVALSFTTSRTSANGDVPLVVVPQYTAAAAAPAGGDTNSVVFETVADLPVVRAELKHAVAVDFARQRVIDIAQAVSASGLAISGDPFARSQPLVRACHIAQPAIFSLDNITELRLRVELAGIGVPLTRNLEIEWGIPGPKEFVRLVPLRDTTANLSRSGEIIFGPPAQWPAGTVNAIADRWLSCHLRATDDCSDGHTWQSCPITRLELSAKSVIKKLTLAAAYHGAIPLDVTRDFFPFGERPRFGEVFYLHADLFAKAGACVTMDIVLTNPASAVDTPIPRASREGNPRLQWEIPTTQGWQAITCKDGTSVLTETGSLTFDVPADAVVASVNGKQGGWLRARLTGGDYFGGHVVSGPLPTAVAPPSIAHIGLNATIDVAPVAAERIIVETNLESVDIHPSSQCVFLPFPALDSSGLTLYLGVSASPQALAARRLGVYLHPGEDADQQRFFVGGGGGEDARAPAALRWQLRGANGWYDCRAIDATHGLQRPGIVEIDLGEEVDRWPGAVFDSKQQLYWLRILWPVASEPARLPSLLALNAVWAQQTMHLANELLGSSTGRLNQEFYTARTPIVGEAMIEVREQNVDVAAAASVFTGAQSGSFPSSWIAWQQVRDFASSDSQSRHFTLNALTGLVRFGDGRQGKIPPRGANNIRVRTYAVGGGERGNCATQTVKQLRTTIPYVESVANVTAATGGRDSQDKGSLMHSGSARLRHRNRAVCSEDYADLAKQASAEVSKARCVSRCDGVWKRLPGGYRAGVVGVVIVPHVMDLRPSPGFALLEQVQRFLDARKPVGTQVVTLGPSYVSVSVDIDIVVAKGASEARTVVACEETLARFLHPVCGGIQGVGWDFGQLPHASDFYPVLGDVSGVDHIRALRLRCSDSRQQLPQDASFLVCAGTLEVRPWH